MSDISTLRRFYLLKQIVAKRDEDEALSAVWQFKKELQPGVTLPSDFPSREALAAVGYTTDEDLKGADAAELAEYAALSVLDADAVIAAAAAL